MKNFKSDKTHYFQFRVNGFTIIPKVITNSSIWSASILSSKDLKNVYVPEHRRKVDAGEGSLKYLALDRFQTDKVVPELNSIYYNLIPCLKEITRLNVISSPYERTAYYSKVYKSKGDEQGWHFDTNGLTVIIYLTDNLTSGRTEIMGLKEKQSSFVCPAEGSILIMKGRECWHRAEPILEGVKVICPLNYYIETAEPRDLRLDDIIFGNV